MKQVLILGAGTAGTMMSNLLRKKLPTNQWNISIVTESETHYYQPGYLFLPFDYYKPEQLQKKVADFIPKGVNVITATIDRIDKDQNLVILQNNEELKYDILIVATGVDIAPDEIEGMEGEEWYKTIFDFYTFDTGE